jgi:hypothetical protein
MANSHMRFFNISEIQLWFESLPEDHKFEQTSRCENGVGCLLWQFVKYKELNPLDCGLTFINTKEGCFRVNGIFKDLLEKIVIRFLYKFPNKESVLTKKELGNIFE